LAWQLVAIAALAAAGICFARQPESLTQPQFWAEDGEIWYQQAYNSGWIASVFAPYNGFLHLVPRIAAGIAMWFPLAYAPLVMNLVGLTIQILPVAILLSSRMRNWGSIYLRSSLALIYLIMPNCAEISITATNAIWHLALAAVLLLLGEPPEKRGWRYLDRAAFALSGLSGPFGIFLLPIAAFLALREPRDRRRRESLMILAAATALQLSIFAAAHARAHGELGVGVGSFCRILGGQVYFETLFGQDPWGVLVNAKLLAVVAAGGTLFIAAAIRSLEGRLFALFAGMVLMASLASPITPPDTIAWKALSTAVGVRYWFFPSLALCWAIVFAIFSARAPLRGAGVLLLVAMTIGVIRDWRHPVYTRPDLASFARELSSLPPGQPLAIRINPPVGDGQPPWIMELIKH